MTQERRRYGFVLERQCSLAKHWLAYHSAGATSYNSGLEEWLEVSRTREYLPPNVEAMFVSRMRVSIRYFTEFLIILITFFFQFIIKCSGWQSTCNSYR